MLMRTCFVFALFVFAFTNLVAKAGTPVDVVGRYSAVLRSFNPRLSPSMARNMAEHVLFISDYYDVDPAFILALVNQESSWHENARSSVGAIGLGQLMPGTARGLQVIPSDALENLDGAVRYIRRQIESFRSVRPESRRYELALAAYNAGPGAVQKYGGIPPYKETIAYVSTIMASWEHLKRILPSRAVAARSIVRIADRRLYVDLALRAVPPVHRTAPNPNAPRHSSVSPSIKTTASPRTTAAPERVITRGSFDIVAFTGITPNAACGPRNLLDPASRCGWDATRGNGVRIGLVLDLGSTQQTIQAVKIRFEKGAVPTGFEIATSDDPRANADEWLGIRYCRVPPISDQVTCTIGVRKPRAVRIIVDGNRASIRKIRLLPAN